MKKSIIQLQLGNYSNFIGTHYWNLHEFSFENPSSNFTSSKSINNDINYHEGSTTTTKQSTFTPKLISWDWNENLGPRIIDDIYEELDNDTESGESRRQISSLKVKSFAGNVVVNSGFTDEELRVNDRSIDRPGNGIAATEYREWNEYSYSRFHWNSLTKLPKHFREFYNGNFRSFSQGLELTDRWEYRDRMENQLRYFVERCDYLDGFQLLGDTEDGFSGVAIGFLNHIADEYSRDVCGFPAIENRADVVDIEAVFNKIFLFNELNAKSALWAPISARGPSNRAVQFDNVQYDVQSKYESSSILAVALKAALLPLALSDNSGSISDYKSLVRSRSRMVSLAAALPFPLRSSETLEASLVARNLADCYRVLSPYCRAVESLSSAVGTIHGIDKTRERSGTRRSKSVFDDCSSVSEMMQVFVRENSASRTSSCRFFDCAERVALRKPFPAIFSSSIDRNCGELRQDRDCHVGAGAHRPDSIPISTILFSNENNDPLNSLYQTAISSFRQRKMSSLLLGLESDYLSDALENFIENI